MVKFVRCVCVGGGGGGGGTSVHVFSGKNTCNRFYGPRSGP